jgi:hypothetical protein
MRLDPLYKVTFTTPEAWSVEVASDAGIEGRGFLLAEGRSAGRLSARYRAANFPRKRSDGALVPEFRGVLETDDGAVILFEWQGLAVLSDSGMRRLLGSLVHTTDDPRYRWLNDRVCAVERLEDGEVLDGLQPPHRQGDARGGRLALRGASARLRLRPDTAGRDGGDGARRTRT